MELLKKVSPFTFFLLPLVLVLRDQLIPPFILLFIIGCIPFFSKPNFKKFTIQVYALPTLYILYIFGLFYTENMEYGLKDIESKLSFVIFPLLYMFTYNNLPKKSIIFAKLGLVAGATISMLLSLCISISCALNCGSTCFFAAYYGFNMHGTYLSVILIMSSVLLLDSRNNLNVPKLFTIAFAGLALFECYLLRSQSSFLIIIVLLLYVVYNMLKSYFKKYTIYLIPILTLSVIGLASLSPKIKNEFNMTYNKVSSYITDQEGFLKNNTVNNESNTVRLVAYSLSWNILKENPLGKGTGDGKDELLKKYKDYGYNSFAEAKYNSHSTFLQTGISIGVLGMIVLLILLVFPFFQKKTRSNRAFILFVFIVLISSLFESFLERQVGIIFFSLGIFILLRPVQNET